MSVQQISVFLESRPGHLRRVLDAFEDAHVSVRGYSASDTGDYGIVRFIVDAPDIALSVKDIARAEKLLAAQPVELIGQDDLARPVAPESR